MLPLTIEPLTPGRLPDYLTFFDHRAFTDNPRWAGCYCYFPLHDRAQVEWQARSGSENRAAISACIAGGGTQGYLAYRSAEVVAWCHAGPWRLYPMLADEPLDDPAATGVIFCFVVAPDQRGRGVASALLAAACDGLRTQGLRWVRAKPQRHAEGAAANHLGPLAMYLKAGFETLHDEAEGGVWVQKRLD